MYWILFIIIVTANGVSTTTQEFNTLTTCDMAARTAGQVSSEASRIITFCVEK